MGRARTALCVLMTAPATSGMVVATALPSMEAAKLFGRVAEKTLYLDKQVGACCHSACSDCEWREPDGGYRFDLLRATVPKWMPLYVSRDFEDERGCHEPVWAQTLFPGDGTCTRQEFATRFAALEFSMPMGPKGAIKADADKPSSEAVDAFWAWLCNGESCDELDAATALQRLQDMSLAENREGAIGEGPDMIVWKEFAKALGAAPFERW